MVPQSLASIRLPAGRRNTVTDPWRAGCRKYGDLLATVVPDRPGALAGLLRVVAEHGGNVVDVEHLRDGIELHVRETAIKLVLQTRGADHGREILEAARGEGFAVVVEREVL